MENQTPNISQTHPSYKTKDICAEYSKQDKEYQ